MASTKLGFMLSDEGRSITIKCATAAIQAGDLVYAPTNDDVLSDTVAAVRNSYAADDILGTPQYNANTGYATLIGVALEDIPVNGYGAIALEGVFMHAVNSDTEAGALVQGDEDKSNKLDACGQYDHKVGYTLTGGSADNKYVIWKLSK